MLAALVAICSAVAVMCFVRESVGLRRLQPVPVAGGTGLQKPL